MAMMMLTLMLASIENPQKQMRANPSVTWEKKGEDEDEDDDGDEDYEDDAGDGDVNDDYEDASDEADGKELATFPFGTKLSTDNLKIYL